MNLNEFKSPKSKNILKNETPPAQERLTTQIIVKLPPSEKTKLEEMALKNGLKLSPLIRSLLKKHDYI